jgi:hypothetical protein
MRRSWRCNVRDLAQILKTAVAHRDQLVATVGAFTLGSVSFTEHRQALEKAAIGAADLVGALEELANVETAPGVMLATGDEKLRDEVMGLRAVVRSLTRISKVPALEVEVLDIDDVDFSDVPGDVYALIASAHAVATESA